MVKKIFFGSVANLFAVFITMTVALIRSALAIRYLPTAEAGVWFIFFNIVALISFCDFGLSPSLSREIGFSSKKENRVLRISNLFFTARRLINVFSIIAIVILFCFGFFYLYRLPFNNPQMHTVLYAFTIFSVGVIIQFQSNPYLAVIYGLGNVAIERYIRAIGPIIGIVISIGLVIEGKFGIFGLVLGYLAQVSTIFILSNYFLKKNIRLSRIAKYLRVIFKRIFEPSIQWTTMIIGAALIFQSSNLIIGYVLGVQFVSQFAVLIQIAAVIMTIGGITGYVLTPFVSNATGKHDTQMVHYYLTLSARVNTAIAIMLAIFFYFFIHPIISIWLGNKFILHKEAFLIMLVAIVLDVHHLACSSIAMAAGYVKFGIIVMIDGILNIILCFIFLHFYGILGAALAIFISQILTQNWYAVFYSLKYLNYPVKKYLINIILPLLIFLIIMLFLEYTFSFILKEIKNLYLQLIIAVAGTSILTLLLGWILLLKAHERNFVKTRIKRWGDD